MEESTLLKHELLERRLIESLLKTTILVAWKIEMIRWGKITNRMRENGGGLQYE